jgi:hypothetical protein
MSFDKKIYTGLACYGTAVGIGIILSTLIMFFGLEVYMETILKLYFFIGCPLVCILLWPFMKRKLK